MIASDRIKNFIKNAEGLRLNAYDDGAGNITIGYGHKLPKGSPVKMITQQIADKYFEGDLGIVETALNNMVNIPLAQREFDALVSLVFNIGTDAFKYSSICLYLHQGLKVEAATWFTRWSHEGKTAIEGLLIRRSEELCIYLGIPVKNY